MFKLLVSLLLEGYDGTFPFALWYEKHELYIALTGDISHIHGTISYKDGKEVENVEVVKHVTILIKGKKPIYIQEIKGDKTYWLVSDKI